MSEARIKTRKGRKGPSPRREAVRDAVPDVQTPTRKKKMKVSLESVADSDEEDD